MKCRMAETLIIITMVVGIFFIATTACALTIHEVDKVCPLCKTQFKAKLAGSGSQFGMRLDLKPFGAIAAPWPVAVCPKCHFVLFTSKLKKEDLVKLNEYVQTKEYQTWGKTRSSYFLMAKLLSTLGRDDLDLAYAYLKASWQEENNKKKLKEDLKLSLKHFDAYLEKGPRKTKRKKGDEEEDASAFQTAQLLKGEILRRLGRFDDAKIHLQKLQTLKSFHGSFLGDIVRYEIKLCALKDSKPHNVSEVKRTKHSEQSTECDK